MNQFSFSIRNFYQNGQQLIALHKHLIETSHLIRPIRSEDRGLSTVDIKQPKREKKNKKKKNKLKIKNACENMSERRKVEDMFQNCDIPMSMSKVMLRANTADTTDTVTVICENGDKSEESPFKKRRKRSFSTEFFLRARQWRDVAEFERKELLKVRVYRSLRQASAALLAVAVITVVFSILDIELNYKEKGDIVGVVEDTCVVKNPGCQFSWNENATQNSSILENNPGQQTKRHFFKALAFAVRVTISVLTVLTVGLIWWYSELERRLLVVRHHLSDSVNLFFSPLAGALYAELILCVIHLPPGFPKFFPTEMQLVTFARLYHIVKYMREHHPMRYHRMTEILKTVASVKLSSTFLLKSYFLKKPLPMLMALYLFNVFAVGYIVFALERLRGKCMEYTDVVWMMGVTITNLGFGDFTPCYWLSRIIISLLSLLGIFQTALIVGVLSDTLVIPPDEKRILASVEKQRADQIRRHAAAKLIQATWRFYQRQKDRDNEGGNGFARRMTFTKYRLRRHAHKSYVDALWQWRRVKTSTETVGQSLEKEFLVDDTAITTTYISRKLDALEKMVRKGGNSTPVNENNTKLKRISPLSTICEGRSRIRRLWLSAGRNALNSKFKGKTKAVNGKIKDKSALCSEAPSKNGSIRKKASSPVSLMDKLKSLKTNQVENSNDDNSHSHSNSHRHPETISSEISSPDLSRDQEKRERQQSNIILQDHLIGKLSNQIKGLEEKQEVVKQEISSIKSLLAALREVATDSTIDSGETFSSNPESDQDRKIDVNKTDSWNRSVSYGSCTFPQNVSFEVTEEDHQQRTRRNAFIGVSP
ncbi:Oidioi.mRNA.OKI2018_I69.PAR.g9631.t1.cds [Oikopleura dioica]|uniref:Oidioi.mRNA.OKI2018_I69.PAR.g9631.t1.cds n=1 Tax=Oikopleura dioica TaxID=34765 RepID=A0ABN7RU55_OIKDI|nr:Oidioi.mRNA.OKI2018_I69.PAR.g9631.t1.cds [Oikopleura dioica]